MCIIVVKPQGVAMPTDETLMNCFESNPDGAGFMYADGKSVRIRKGYMDFKSFKAALDEEVPAKDETSLVMHFRIATHGKVVPSCCHPFPMSSKEKDLKALQIESRYGIAHNGVIAGRYTTKAWSDTMDFVAKVAYPMMRACKNFMHNSWAMDALEGAANSKLAIMDNSGEVVTIGSFVEDEGCLFSNTSYLTYKSRW